MHLTPNDQVLDPVDAFCLHDIVTGPAGTFVTSFYRLWEVDYGRVRLDESRPDVDLRSTKTIGQGASWPRDPWWDSYLALRPDGRLGPPAQLLGAGFLGPALRCGEVVMGV